MYRTKTILVAVVVTYAMKTLLRNRAAACLLESAVAGAREID